MTRLDAARVSTAAVIALTCVLLSSCSRQESPTSPQRMSTTTTILNPVIGDPPGEGDPEDAIEKVVVVLDDGASVSSFCVQHDVTELQSDELDGDTYRLVRANAGQPAGQLLASVSSDPNVKFAFAVVPLENAEMGGQPMSFDDGHGTATASGYRTTNPVIESMDLPYAQAHARGDGVFVAILDTGLDTGHPEFWGAQIMPGQNTTGDVWTSDVEDVGDGEDNDGDGHRDEGVGHGTHVTGIVLLVAPHARIIPVKVLDDEGRGDSASLFFGLVYAINHGASIVNMSLGLVYGDELTKRGVDAAYDHGVAVVSSAGNQGIQGDQYPAAYGHAFSVTAVDEGERLAAFANWSTTVDASAPGVSVVSTFPTNSALGPYAAGTGTSMAAPFFSGVAALVQSISPGSSGVDAAGEVKHAGKDIDKWNGGYEGLIGPRRVHAGCAISDVLSLPYPPSHGL